jgi:hypothetical protein
MLRKVGRDEIAFQVAAHPASGAPAQHDLLVLVQTLRGYHVVQLRWRVAKGERGERVRGARGCAGHDGGGGMGMQSPGR